jgi:hypothetical protein
MTGKIGRNDPCPCGSGKKYKHCHGNAGATAVEPEKTGHDGAVGRALDWLMSKHRKAVSVALDEMLFDGLRDEERAALEAQDQDTRRGIQLNATEWLLAEGEILVKGERRRVSDHLLGHGGPLFTSGQRDWIAQLADRPLRLYDVTEVIPGHQLTLCDALATEAPPITVREKSGSQASLIGMQIGFRLMEVDGHYELSGAAYPFSRLAGPRVIARLRESMPPFGARRRDQPELLSAIIRRQWLAQYFAPMPIPTMMDAYSGEPLLLINDHYRVVDWPALVQSLAAQNDVEGDRESGWTRLVECQDGVTRATAGINRGTDADRLTVFYKTQGYADQGRPWFGALAGDAVQFICREISDPKRLMADRLAPGSTPRAKSRTAAPSLPPEVMAEVIEQAILRSYANWADEPIPALDNKTPRQAIKTPAGLERVKGLLRGYEASERQQAEEQGRRVISYAFLWEALGIAS